MSGALSGPFESWMSALAAAREAAGVDADGPILAGVIPGGNQRMLTAALGAASEKQSRYRGQPRKRPRKLGPSGPRSQGKVA